MNKELIAKASTTINAPIAKVWEVLTKPKLWWSDVVLEPKVGGMFEERWNGNITVGSVVAFKPPRQLKLSWKDADWPDYTYVTFSLTSRKQATNIELLHEGWEIFPREEAEQLIRDHRSGWDMHLNDLKLACESKH